MGRLHLTKHQHQRLTQLTKSGSRFVSRKAIALLEIDSGQVQKQVADRLGVESRTLRRWIQSFLHEDLRVSLKDGRAGQSGRPIKWNHNLQEQFDQALKHQPNELGYQAVVWTVDLLKIHLAKKTKTEISTENLRRRLHKQKYVWKRPKYQLITDPQKRKKNHRSQTSISEGKRQVHIPF